MDHFDDNIWTRRTAAIDVARSLSDARESLMNPGGIPEAAEELHREAIRRASRTPSATQTELARQALEAADYSKSQKIAAIAGFVTLVAVVEYFVFVARFGWPT